MFTPTGRVPGFATDGEGMLSPSMIDPDDFHSVASQQYNKNYHTSFAMGGSSVDFRWEQSRKDQVELTKRRAAAQHYTGAPLAANRALSVLTGGASTFAMKQTMGEEAGDALLRARNESPGTDFVGTMLGVAGLALLPFPGAATLGGKIAGGKGAAAAANVRNLFGVSAASGQRAMNLVQGGGFAKGVAAATVSGLVAEVPLSMAVASADLVDNNRQWTVEAFAHDAGVMTAWGMLLAGGTGLPVMAGRHLLGAGMRGARSGVQAAKGLRDQLTYATEAAAGGLGYRFTRGIRSSGTTAGLVTGSVLESVNRSLWRGWGKRQRSGVAKWVMNEVPQDFVTHVKKFRKAVSSYDVGAAESAHALRRTSKELLYNVEDAATAASIKGVINNADAVFAARAYMSDAPEQVARIRSFVNEIDTKIPKGVRFKSDAVNDLAAGLIEVSLEMDVWNRGLDSMKPGNRAQLLIKRPQAPGFRLAKDIHAASQALPNNPRQALGKVLELRKRLETEATISAPRLRAILDRRIEKATGGSGNFMELMNGLDRARWNVNKAAELAEGIGATSKIKNKVAVEKYATRLKRIENELDLMPKDMAADRARSVYREASEIWDDAARREAAQQVAGMNEFRNNMLMKDSWYPVDPVTGQLSDPIFKTSNRELTREALLETQIEMAISTKMGIRDAFIFLKDHGGPTRQSTMFAGVFHYRQMAGHDERLAAFEANRSALLRGASGPEAMIQNLGNVVGKLASADQEVATGYAMVNSRAAQYLLQHLPQNEDGAPPSPAEAESWLERLGALEPSGLASLIYAANDGSVMPEAVDAVRTVLPAMYVDMLLDLSDFVEEFGDELNHTQLIGLDLLAGGALGIVDSVTPMQPPMSQTPLQSQTMGSFGPQRMQRLQAVMQTPNQKLGGL